ncbi:hypothetical protein ACROYT_G042398 [Oculina patagonica]
MSYHPPPQQPLGHPPAGMRPPSGAMPPGMPPPGNLPTGLPPPPPFPGPPGFPPPPMPPPGATVPPLPTKPPIPVPGMPPLAVFFTCSSESGRQNACNGSTCSERNAYRQTNDRYRGAKTGSRENTGQTTH